jgi:precorrin-6B methylase 2
MDAIVIQSNSVENLKLLKELALKLGENVTSLNAEQLEDLAFGLMMKNEKTVKNVSRETIMKKLRTT